MRFERPLVRKALDECSPFTVHHLFWLWVFPGGEGLQSLQVHVHVGQSHGPLLQGPEGSGPQEGQASRRAGE